MTAPFPAPDRGQPVGAAPVATLRDLDNMQALAVMMMRDGFCNSPGQLRVRDVFVNTLGASAGAAAAGHWAEFARFLVANARRPLMCHARACPCVGADEAVVAHLLFHAATGAREDAMLILMLLIPGDRALCAVMMAEGAGRAVMRAARIAAQRPDQPIETLH